MSFPTDWSRGLLGWFSGVRWLPKEQLPPEEEGRDKAQKRYRADYERCFASNDIGPALAQIRTWFERQVR